MKKSSFFALSLLIAAAYSYTALKMVMLSESFTVPDGADQASGLALVAVFVLILVIIVQSLIHLQFYFVSVMNEPQQGVFWQTLLLQKDCLLSNVIRLFGYAAILYFMWVSFQTPYPFWTYIVSFFTYTLYLLWLLQLIKERAANKRHPLKM
ncbi:hypothetical protein SAMN05444162_3584 [Paenibacillaceae bacterium GAS479]|nr:hypothetical protein SAMN05444162_3584 [Paenibacillaceae bacterium GAS479]